MTETGVPMHRSSQDSPLSVSEDIGRMQWTAPQGLGDAATAHVTTNAQLSQCLAQMEG